MPEIIFLPRVDWVAVRGVEYFGVVVLFWSRICSVLKSVVNQLAISLRLGCDYEQNNW